MRWRWPDGIGLVLAIGLVLTPWLVGLTGAAAASAWAIGVAAVVAFGVALPRPGQASGWINLGLAVALILAPFVLGFTAAPRPLWSHWLFGVLIGVAALWSLARTGADARAGDAPPS